MDETRAAQLVGTLRWVRDELRDLASHPLVGELVAELPRGGASESRTERLWALAERVSAAFAYCEPCQALVRLEQLLEEDHHAAASASAATEVCVTDVDVTDGAVTPSLEREPSEAAQGMGSAHAASSA